MWKSESYKTVVDETKNSDLRKTIDSYGVKVGCADPLNSCFIIAQCS